MDRYEEGEATGRQPSVPRDEGTGTAPTGPPRVEKKRRKVSLIAAIVVNVVTIIVIAIILLVFLLPGYRRSYTVARAITGADEVWVVVKTTEAQMRSNSTDFLSAQDGLRNALQEMVKAGSDTVSAYVRDSLPDHIWVSQNLPNDMQQWLQQLYPQPAT
ncbi:MAG: hypothetical protein A2W01_00810 [Candidatus Solincola sediminis]|uniref:Uncharacterized protein n=1 Tax=Candidatus Solincola sediminis TaxID=1797199 RepID=A0A1F2WR54_9ACTN|nr:MAG: hypothetical protein A2Y75_10790 [Candidatus Solincola sediminis]OFW61127.1 MAG: hypothetical protein A2W01_00810 [Candidatus Solincola sediminis]